jgi:predicted DNA-binding protein
MKEDQDFNQEAFNALKEMMKDRFPVLAEKFTRNAAIYVRKAEQAVLEGDKEGNITPLSACGKIP